MNNSFRLYSLITACGRWSGATIRRLRWGLAMAACLLAGACLAAPNYYVATNGNDNDAGNESQPFRTIQHAVNVAQGPATILIRAGVYTETVAVNASGSQADGFLTIRNADQDKVVIDGTDLPITNGQSGLITITDQSYVRIQGLELRNFRSSSTAVPMGISISGRGDHLQIVGNHIHNIETTYPGCDGNAMGIGVYGDNARESLNAIEITANELDHLATGCSESLTLNGNVENFLIADNTIHDTNNIGIDIIGFEGTSGNRATDQARNGIIRGNTLYNISSYDNSAYGEHEYGADAIYVDGGRDVLIERNRIHDSDIGIELASEHRRRVTSGVTVRNNLIYWNNLTGISIGGYARRAGGTQGCTIVNNTLYQNDTKHSWSGEFQIQYNASDNLFKNNILVANEQGLFVNDAYRAIGTPAHIDFNLYYSPAGESAAEFSWNGRSYTSLADFRRASQDAAAATFANPAFTSTGYDATFSLSPDSPAINAGLTLDPSIIGDTDFAGNPRVDGGAVDVGAVEF